MKKYLCTLFDINYLPLGIALYSSLLKYYTNFHLWILALDEKSYLKLLELNLKNVTVIALSEIEDEELRKAKLDRSWQEYCWTLSPVLPSFILDNYLEIDHITYIDSDIFFYNSLDDIYKEINDSSIMIIPHRFPDRLKHFEINGIYNVQMIYFKKDSEGISCLKRWRKLCIEWCYNKIEPGRFGDQKYLDEWPILYKDICILNNIGAGVALWNAENYILKETNFTYYVNDNKLIFYHFHQYKYFKFGFYLANFHNYNLNDDYNSLYRIYTKTIYYYTKKYNLPSMSISFNEIINLYTINPSFFHFNPIINYLFKIISKIVYKILRSEILKILKL